MPPPSQQKKVSPDLVAQILLAEAAGEPQPQGLTFVRDVLYNRAKRAGKSLEEIATQPKQFSASSRPALGDFFSRQPIILQNLARELVAETQQKDFTPQYPDIEHYVTQALYERRFEPQVPSWIRDMEPAGLIGHHVALRPRTRQ